MTSDASPVLVSVTIFCCWIPIGEAKLTEPGEKLATGTVPVPERLTPVGLVGSLLVIDASPDLAPALPGSNSTVNVHDPPTRMIVLLHPSVLFVNPAPVTATPPSGIESTRLPLFVTVN